MAEFELLSQLVITGGDTAHQDIPAATRELGQGVNADVYA